MATTRSPQRFLRLLTVLFAAVLLAAACSGGDSSGDEEDASGSASETTPEEDEEDAEDEEDPEEDPDDEGDEEDPEDEGDEEDRDDAVGDFGDEVKDEVDEMDEAPGEDTYGEYVTVQDDSGYITIDVPAAWADVDGREGLFGPDVIASTDVQAWIETYDVSGLEFQATGIETNQTPDEVLDAVSGGQFNDCVAAERDVYTDPIYTGVFQVFERCGGSETGFVWLAFEPFDGSFHAVLGVQLVVEADIEALETALTSFVLGA